MGLRIGPVCLRLVALVAWVFSLPPGAAYASVEEQALEDLAAALEVVSGRLGDLSAVKDAPRATPEQRLAGGELYLAQGNYDEAIDTFNQVVELARQKKVSAATHADALYLLGEAYFRDGQLLSARRHYADLAALAGSRPYGTYAARAISRVVDIALRTRRHDGLDEVFKQLAALTGSDPSGVREYAKGKAHFAVGAFEPAIGALQLVRPSAPVYPQSQYLLGVIYLKQTQLPTPVVPSPKEADTVPDSARPYARAILQFQKLSRLKAETPEQRHVADLAWMALARIFYETGNPLDAVDAYQRIPRDSPEFATMLSELGWAYVALEDFGEAQRALEVLSVVSPQRLEFAEGALLKADLLLRAKDYEKARLTYRQVRRQFEPIEAEVRAFLKAHPEPELYYDRLLDRRLGVKTEDALPPLLLDWLGDDEANPVFSLIDDVSRARLLVRESDVMLERMNAVLDSPARTGAFPELRAQLIGAVGLLNRLAKGKYALALAYDEIASPGPDGRAMQAKRLPLMDRFQWLPVTRQDFSQRDEAGRKGWLELSQRLQRIELDADKLRAVVNALERVLKNPDRFGVSDRPGFREQIEQEVLANRGDLEVYAARISDLRHAIDRGRLHVGFGDARTLSDDRVRREFDALFEQELRAAAAGAAGERAANFARDALALWARVIGVQQKLEGERSKLEAEVDAGLGGLRLAVDKEARTMAAHTDSLDLLDQNARHLVGEAARESFASVGQRLRSIVMRADIGITQEAWEVRARHLERLRSLQRARAREERALDAELKEVLDGERLQ